MNEIFCVIPTKSNSTTLRQMIRELYHSSLNVHSHHEELPRPCILHYVSILKSTKKQENNCKTYIESSAKGKQSVRLPHVYHVIVPLECRSNHKLNWVDDSRPNFHLQTFNYGTPWPAVYINFMQITHHIQVLAEPLCRAEAILYALPNNERGTKYRGLTYSVRQNCPLKHPKTPRTPPKHYHTYNARTFFKDTNGFFVGGGGHVPPSVPGCDTGIEQDTYSDRAKRPPAFLKS